MMHHLGIGYLNILNHASKAIQELQSHQYHQCPQQMKKQL